MSMKIIKASDPIRVDRLNVCIYGQPGAGKTSLAFTAESPLLLDFDNGAQRAANRRDVVRVTDWRDVVNVTAEDLAPYRTIVADTVGRALDLLSADIIRRNPKHGRGGALTLQGYGALKAEFTAWLKLVNSFGKDVVLIAHMDEQRNGDEIIERLDVQGGSKSEIYKAADAMGRVFVRGQIRELDFSPRENSFGKNPGQLAPLAVPHPDADPQFLATVIQNIKDKLNELTAEQMAAQKAIEEWRAKIAAMSTAEHFNGALDEIKTAPRAAARLLNDAAKNHGLGYDKAAGAFVAVPEAA